MDARLLAMMELKTQQNKIETPTEDIIKESSERKQKGTPSVRKLDKKGDEITVQHTPWALLQTTLNII